MIVQYKSKEELDLLETYDDVNFYRREILRSDNPDWKRYVGELRIYMDERFVDRVLDQYSGYIKVLSKNKSLTNAINNSENDAIVLVAKSIELCGGVEKYYTAMMSMLKNELGESEYKLYKYYGLF